MTPQLKAALALGEEAKRRAEEPFIAEAIPAADSSPILIEGVHTNGRELRVTLPSGAVWLYDLPLPEKAVKIEANGEPSGFTAMPGKRTVLVNLHLTAPKHASVFQPTAEGIHPFVGVATRIGVERGARA